MKKNTLVISGHPNLENSLANRTVLRELHELLPNLKIRHLDKIASEGKLDIAEEQDTLLEADIIVFQFPLHWYSYPALLKNYLDQVFLHGFAYGSKAKLAGKTLLHSFTAGAPSAAYSTKGILQHSISDFTIPFQVTTNYCQMQYVDPVYTCGCLYIPNIHTKEDAYLIQEKCLNHAHRLYQELISL